MLFPVSPAGVLQRFVPPVSPEAPAVTNLQWNDSTKTLTFNCNDPAILHLVTHDAGADPTATQIVAGLAAYDAFGPIAAPAGSFQAVLETTNTPDGAREMSFVMRDTAQTIPVANLPVHRVAYTDVDSGNVIVGAENKFTVSALAPLVAPTLTAGNQLVTVDGTSFKTLAYRRKSPQGDWILVSGTMPFDITGLTNGVVYEFETGSGALQERTPAGAGGFVEQGTVWAGASSLRGATALANPTEFLFFASYIPAGSGRMALMSTSTTTQSMYSWSLAPDMRLDAGGGALFGPTAAPVAIGERVHMLGRGFRDTQLRAELVTWQGSTGAWSAVYQDDNGGPTSTFDMDNNPLRLLERTNDGHFFNGTLYRLTLWFGVSPDVSQAAVQDLFTNGGSIIDPAVAIASLGTPIFDIRGNAAAVNTAAHNGSYPGFTFNGPAVTDA